MSGAPTQKHPAIQNPEYLENFKSDIVRSKAKGQEKALVGNRNSLGGQIRACGV